MILFVLHVAGNTRGFSQKPPSIQQRLQQHSEALVTAEKNGDLDRFLHSYAPNAIVMPEYQLTRTGLREIREFYQELFQRQQIRTLEHKADEWLWLTDSAIVELGTFRKQFIDPTLGDSLQTHRGQYWHIWRVQPDGTINLQGEAYGFFHPVTQPERLVVATGKQPDEPEIYADRTPPFELLAYNALMEKGVRTRNGPLRSSFFTEDGSFKPFAEELVTGLPQIKPYLIAYSSRGVVTIDSVRCYTYASDTFERYTLEYAMFKVQWHRADAAGRTEGKGIRIWKRQPDHSLKLYREIGTHNHLEP
ncbi:YybH family protein [Larkinella sp. VNQ87]|uniref:YybH family protein n=1 Tax=Larkinella sp. VNQ87 TaxID=3400921 RepID=UPI003C07DA0B